MNPNLESVNTMKPQERGRPARFSSLRAGCPRSLPIPPRLLAGRATKPRERGCPARFLRTGHHRSPSASALIVSLAFVVLIAILVVGFATTARLERDIVESHSAKLQAGLLNEMAVRVAQARLQNGTATTANSTWLSQPGRLTTISGNTNEFFDLTSGASANANATQDVSVDLNPPPLLNSERAISGNLSVSMPVKWIYVRQDGSLILDPSAAPTYDAGNPIVGRFAFWTDDLSARINLNTATAASATNPPTASWPGHQNLTALLTASDIAALKSYRANNHFESARDALRATNSTTLRAALANQKFDVTHFSHSPSSLNVFGEPKIVLTTQSNRAHLSTNYFKILSDETKDPGTIDGVVDATKYNALFTTLYGYLSRTNWPLMPGKSFVQKYGPNGATQIILNLIDYVRSAESTNVLVEASRGEFNENTGTFAFKSGSGGTSKTFMGNARRLLITQLGVWMGDTPPFKVNFYTEVFLPLSAGGSVTNLQTGRDMFNQIAYDEMDGGNLTRKILVAGVNSPLQNVAGSGSARYRLDPGEFRTIIMSYPGIATNNLANPTNRPAGNIYLRSVVRVANNNNYGVDIVPTFAYLSSDGPGEMIAYPLNGPGIPEAGSIANIHTVAVNDPVINKHRLDWTNAPVNTLGINANKNTPVSTLGQSAGSLIPQQDTDDSGRLTDVGFGFPAVKGSIKNPRGRVESLGELGRIHTGGNGIVSMGFSDKKGTPWRTLRIQPRVSSDTTLPDWLLLNLFAVPEGANGVTAFDAAIMQPTANAVAGRVNVNARIFPTNWTTTNRTAPLLSALTANATGTPLPNPQAAATNILEGTLATGSNPGRWYGSASFTNTHLFFLPEQIVEIKDVADGGEASEARLANILPFLTTRSSAFAVYSVGQKIRQLKSGVIKVLGESRSMTILERLDNGTFREHSTTDLGL